MTPLPVRFEGADKLAHAAAYAVLALALAWADRFPTGARAWGWVGVAALYGATDELHQWLVPPRQPDPLDWLADLLGAALMMALILQVQRLRARRAVSGS